MMRRLTAVVFAGLVVLTGAVVSGEPTPTAKARELFFTGEYAQAREALEAVLKDDPKSEEATELLMTLDTELGRFESASTRGEAFVRESPKSVRVRSALAWALYHRGKVEEANREARRARVLDRSDLNARYLTALIQYERGDRLAAKHVFESFIDVWQTADEKDLTAEQVTRIGEACTFFALADRNAGMLKTIVNTVYPLAVKKDPNYTPAMVASGRLFLEKYNVPQAIEEFKTALRVNPRHPLALIGLAYCELSRRQFPEASEYLAEAAKTAPDHPEVLLFDALLSLHDQDYEAALDTTRKVLRVNPAHQEALGMEAACLYELERPDDYAAAEKRALEVNPKCSVFYETVASALILRHRDAEAEPLLRKAVELSPNDSGPVAHLGLLLMRHGREVEAYKVLEDAHAMDAFNVLVYNTLNLLDQMKDYEEVKTEHFTVKVHPKSDRVLAEYASRYLESIYPEVTAHYAHEVPHTLIEIFPSHRMFSVRTTGVPNVGTVGACLGPMVVMDSPLVMRRPGAFNWADVLRHEFTHVVTLSATDMKIAHWFTEALAVTEQAYPRPYPWRQMLVDAVARGELMPVTKLTHGFTRARTQRIRQLAYAQSHLIAVFVIETWGREKLVAMLEGYRAGKSTEAVVTSVFGMSSTEFDDRFAEWMKTFTAKLKLTPGPAVRDREEVERLVADNPENAELRIELARIRLARRDLTGASVDLQKALAIEPANARAHALLGSLRLAQRNTAEAKQAYLRALALDPNERTALAGMLRIAQMEKSDPQTLLYLKRLETLDPENPGVHRGLAGLYEKQKNIPAAVEHWRKAALADGQDYVSRRKLIEILLERQQYKDAARYVEEAIRIWPYDRRVHEWGEVAFAKIGDTKRAELEKRMIPLTPEPRTPRTPAPPDDVPPDEIEPEETPPGDD
ncbi:MAG TPA: tetratricopeptide repeat protein [Planctomycetota bacterium]|nr:tetratricopeptide repeat protein [Planctomycetota bacterium]